MISNKEPSQKELLEIKKLEIEILKLSLPFWKKITFWAIIIPAVIMVIQLVITYKLAKDSTLQALKQEQVNYDINLKNIEEGEQKPILTPILNEKAYH